MTTEQKSAVSEALSDQAIQKTIPNKVQKKPRDIDISVKKGWNLSEGAGAVLKVLFYVICISFVGFIIYFLITNFEWRLGKFGKRKEKIVRQTVTSIKKQKQRTDELPNLNDIKALAAQGNYSDAVHLILIMSIDHIQKKLKGLLSISDTSREIVSNRNVDQKDQDLIKIMVQKVEATLFAGHQVSDQEYEQCLSNYQKLIGHSERNQNSPNKMGESFEK